MFTHALRFACLAWFLLAVAPATVKAQAAPPVDQSEDGGNDNNNEIRIGSAVVSGSAWIDGRVGLGSGRVEPDTFELRRVRLGLAGVLSDRLGYNVSGELTDQPVLRNAFFVLRLSEQVSLRVGQANTMGSLERGSGLMTLELIDRSRPTAVLTAQSDVGMTLFTTAPHRGWLGYAVSVTNGTGSNSEDDNSSKDVAGRISVSPVPVPGLQVVVSGGRGMQPGGLRTRAGLGVDYRRGPWHLQAESLRQRRDNLPASNGHMAMVAYRYEPAEVRPYFSQLEFAARVWVLNDHASAAGEPSEVVDEDGGVVVTNPGIATTREFQTGVSYSISSNVRLRVNVAVPFDEREDVGPRLLMRWQLQF